MQRFFQMSGKFRAERLKLHVFQFFCHEAGFFHIAVLNGPELDIVHGDFQDVVFLEEQFFICSVSVVCFSLLPVKPFAVGIPGDLFLYELKNIFIAFFFLEFFIYFLHDLIDFFLRNILLKGQENVRGDLQKAGDRRQHGDVGER